MKMKILGPFMVLIIALSGCVDSALQSKITPLDKALSENPQDAQAHYELGKIWLEAKRYAKAVEHLERAVQLNPGNIDAYVPLATAYTGMKNYGRAVEILRRPELAKHPETSFALGSAHIGQGNFVSGKERLIEALAGKPELSRVLNAALGDQAAADSPPLSAMEKAMAEVLDRIMEEAREELLENIREDIRESIIMDR